MNVAIIRGFPAKIVALNNKCFEQQLKVRNVDVDVTRRTPQPTKTLGQSIRAGQATSAKWRDSCTRDARRRKEPAGATDKGIDRLLHKTDAKDAI